LVVKQDNIINASVWERLATMFANDDDGLDFVALHGKMKDFIHKLSIHYNIDKKQIIKDYYGYQIKTTPHLTSDMIGRMEVVMHNYDCGINALVDYFIMDGAAINGATNK